MCQRASPIDVADTQGLSMERGSHEKMGGEKETDNKGAVVRYMT